MPRLAPVTNAVAMAEAYDRGCRAAARIAEAHVAVTGKSVRPEIFSQGDRESCEFLFVRDSRQLTATAQYPNDSHGSNPKFTLARLPISRSPCKIRARVGARARRRPEVLPGAAR